MAWETRKRGGRYYTRSRRLGGRVVREYMVGGLLGQLAAELDREKRVERQKRAETWQAERVRLEAADAAVQRLCDMVERLARASLFLAGYHQHHRGEWRRRHEPEQSECNDDGG